MMDNKQEQEKIEDKEQELKQEQAPEAENQALEECEKKKEEYLAGWQRARADFLNYKKQETDKITGLVFFAQAEVILSVLEILDSFDKAKLEIERSAKESDLSDNEQMVQGFLCIEKQIMEILKKYDIEEIKAIGEKFNPEFAEAVEQISTDKEPGIIVEETQKGYRIAGKVLRPAKVKVAK